LTEYHYIFGAFDQTLTTTNHNLYAPGPLRVWVLGASPARALRPVCAASSTSPLCAYVGWASVWTR